MTTFGLFMGGVALQFKSLYILYFLCALPCGFGGLAIYQRLVFIHQLWFKKIGKKSIGAYLFFKYMFFTVFLIFFKYSQNEFFLCDYTSLFYYASQQLKK